MFQMTWQQLPFQARGEGEALGRALVMFRDITRQMTDSGDAADFDLEAEFESFTGLTIEQFIWSGMSLLGAATKAPFIRVPWTEANEKELARHWRGPERDRPTRKTMMRFLHHVALTPREFKKRIGNINDQEENLVAYDFQPLLSYPVVLTHPQEVVVPIPKLLLDRITTGIFHDFSNYLDGGKGSKTARFRTMFGELFERYVHMQLLLVFDEDELVYESPYRTSEGQKSTPDWTVNSKDALAGIECRTGTFSLESRKTGDEHRVDKDIERIFVPVIVKLESKMDDILASKTPIVPRSDKAFPVICSWEGMSTLGLYGYLLFKKTKSHMRGRKPLFHLIPIAHLERLCATGDRDVFFKGLEILKVEEDWMSISDDGPRSKFEDLVGDETWSNPIATGAYDRFMESIAT